MLVVTSHTVVSYAVTRILGTTFESFVFAYIGMSTFGIEGHDLNVVFVALSFLFCLVGRALNTFPLSLALNKLRKRKVPFGTQFVIWFSGLRGAIAFALSLEIDTENKNLLKTTTLAIVLLTTFCIGGGTLPLLEFLKIVGPRSKTLPVAMLQEKEAITQSKMWFLRADREIITPFLCKHDKIPDDRKSHSPDGANKQTGGGDSGGDMDASNDNASHSEVELSDCVSDVENSNTKTSDSPAGATDSIEA